MKKKARRNYSSAFKAKVALASIKGDRTIVQLSEQFDIHPNHITAWKDQPVEYAAEDFERGASGKGSALAVDIKTLHAKIGELTRIARPIRATLAATSRVSHRIQSNLRSCPVRYQRRTFVTGGDRPANLGK
jgi:transposase